MIDSKAIVAQVQENQRKLAGCSKHDFVRVDDKLFSKYRCTQCCGVVDSSAALWYKAGLKHAHK